MNSDNIYVVCSNRLEIFKTKEEAKNYYSHCYHLSEGAEREEYASILMDLDLSNLGKDFFSDYCSEISLKLDKQSDVFLTLKLKDTLSIKETIKYYEEKIKPIIEVANDYNINFDRDCPFDSFGSDEEVEDLSIYGFSKFYNEILRKMNVYVEEINTIEKSDGKYEMLIDNGLIVDIKVWDKLDDVDNNISLIINYIKRKEKETIL